MFFFSFFFEAYLAIPPLEQQLNANSPPSPACRQHLLSDNRTAIARTDC